jgi:hypothetical protein
MIVRFVDIDGIFYHCHYCLKFLFIALISLFWKTKTRRQVDHCLPEMYLCPSLQEMKFSWYHVLFYTNISC